MKWRTLVHWVNENPNGFVLAVGDVLPLLFAWGASRKSRKKHRHAMDYAFVGTAKSEYYIPGEDGPPFTTEMARWIMDFFLNLRPDDMKWRTLVHWVLWEMCFHFYLHGELRGDQERTMDYGFVGTAKSEYYVRGDDGHLLQRKWPVDSYVYYPWEQALMANNDCRLVVPRDALASMALKERLPPAARSKATPLGRIVTLLPGSRAPEVYANRRIMLEAAREVSKVIAEEKLMFLVPVVPSLDQDIFFEALTAEGWLQSTSTQVHQGVMFERNNAVLLLLKGGFNEACHGGDAGIAMAGTATEQLVGLGKPIFTIAGGGPQYTYAFAEAQTRLLGRSVFLCSDPVSLGRKMQQILSNKDTLVQRMVSQGWVLLELRDEYLSTC